MNKYKIIGIMLLLGLLAGCKSKVEKMADEFLEQDKLQNAIMFYTKAEQRGKTSETFNDNFTRAYIRMAAKMAKSDPTSSTVSGYLEQVNKLIASSANDTVIEEVVGTLAQIGALQASKADGIYEAVLQGFNNIKTAEDLSAKHNDLGAKALKSAREKAEAQFVSAQIEASTLEEHPVAQEYQLLLADVVAPKNEKLIEALNKVRPKNRDQFLIFEAVGVEKPSRWVNKYGYVMAFPSIKITKTNLKGELVFWNSTGNNTELDLSKVKLVSTEGEEIVAKQIGSGWCTGTDHLAKTKEKLVGKGKLLDEKQCSALVSFNYGAGFVPDYVEYKDNFGVGRKYLGY